MPNPSSPQANIDPIVVIATPDRILELLRLAVLRSDAVTAVTPTLDGATRRFVDAFAVAHRAHEGDMEDLAGAGAALLALSDVAAENEIVRAARRCRVPIYVAGRALVSDFTPLALVEQRPLSSLAA